MTNTLDTDRPHRCVIVVTGPDPVDQSALADLPTGATVIGADSGADRALDVGLRPAMVIGDLDSISATGLDWALHHAEIVEHPVDKDETDTQLALRTAADLDPEHLILLTGGGDRLDHILAMVGALASRDVTSIPHIEARWGGQVIRIVHGPGRATINTRQGSTVSVIAIAGSATGVDLHGTQWPLDREELEPLSGRGVSNIALGSTIAISVTTGVLAVFHDPPGGSTS